MKKNSILIVGLIILAALLLAGCISAGEKTDTLTRGSWANNTYTSKYTGLSFVMPEGWVYASDEELANLMSIGTEVMSEAGMKFSEKMLELQTIYDMMAQDPVSGTNVIVMYDNLSVIVGGGKYSEEDYLNVMKKQLQASQMDYRFDETADANIANKAYKMIKATVVMNGLELEQYYFMRKIDNYMLGIIVSLFGDEDIDKVMANFS